MLRWIVASIAAAAVALLFVKPRYTATTALVIETGRSQLTPTENGRDALVDTAVVETQVETLRSDGIARSVIDKLQLWDQPEFAGDASGHLTQLLVAMGLASHAPRTQDEVREATLGKFRRSMRVARLGRSYVTEVSFTSHDPNKAATIANAIAQAYIDDQTQARAQSAKRAGQWMVERLGKLRAEAASTAVPEDSKSSRNPITDTGNDLADSREVEQLSAALAEARTETSQARARLDRVKAILKPDALPNDFAVAIDESGSELLSRLRQQYLEIAGKESERSAREGSDHREAVRLRADMAVVQKSIRDEIERITAGHRNAVEAAEARERALERRVTEAFQQAAITREAMARLRTADAQTSKLLYENLLARYAQNFEQQTFPIVETRVISEASVPLERSSPRVKLVLLLSSLAGGLVGIAAAVRKEYLRTLVRRPEQLEAAGIAGLGAISLVPGRLLFPARQSAPPLLLRDRMDTLRGVMVALDEACERTGCCVTGIVSARPGEGKSTIAFNLATLGAESSSRTLLIDANLHRPTLTAGLSRGRGAMGAIIEARTTLAEGMTRNELGFDFLGAGRDVSKHPSLMLGSAAMGELIAQARESYDRVFVDLPNMLDHVEARVAAPLFDALVLVVEWGATSEQDVVSSLGVSRAITTRLAGGLINKAPRPRT